MCDLLIVMTTIGCLLVIPTSKKCRFEGTKNLEERMLKKLGLKKYEEVLCNIKTSGRDH